MKLLAIIPQKMLDVVKVSSIVGLISATTLFINLNFKAFKMIFKEKSRSYWWLFLMMAIAPLLIFLYLFTLFFGSLS